MKRKYLLTLLSPCGYLNSALDVLQHSNVTQEAAGLSGYVPKSFDFLLSCLLKFENLYNK